VKIKQNQPIIRSIIETTVMSTSLASNTSSSGVGGNVNEDVCNQRPKKGILKNKNRSEHFIESNASSVTATTASAKNR